MSNQDKWDRFYLDLARFTAERLSKDPSTKVGAVVVNYELNREFIGYNGFPRKIIDSEDRYLDRDFKLLTVVHAEVNAILKAGDYSRGATLYVWPSFSLPPICQDCVKLAIQQGIKEIVGYLPDPNNERVKRWQKSMDHSKLMCEEAGIIYRGIEEIEQEKRM